jgi:hypothetical protein
MILAEMTPADSPGIKGGGIKESSRGSEFKHDIFDTIIVKTFVNATVYPTQHNNKKKRILNL